MINTKRKLPGFLRFDFGCIRGGNGDIIIGLSVFQDLDIDLRAHDRDPLQPELVAKQNIREIDLQVQSIDYEKWHPFKRSAVKNTKFFYFYCHIREVPEYGKTEVIHIKDYVGIDALGNLFIHCRLNVILENHRDNHGRCHHQHNHYPKADQDFLHYFHTA